MAQLILKTALVTLICAVGLASIAGASERYTWNGPYNVTTDPNQTYGFDPAMVQTQAGTFFALMAGTVSGGGGVYLLSSSDGATWDSPAYVTSGWDECDIIQGFDGFLYAAISTGGGVEIWRGNSSGSGWAYWGQVVSIGGGSQYWTGSLCQAPDGMFYCAFMDHDGSSHHVYVSSSSDAVTWSSKVLVPAPGSGHYFDPNIAELNGVLHVVYNSYYNYEMWTCSSVDGGLNWTNPLQITNGASTSAFTGPSIAEGPDGAIVVAYGTSAKGLAISQSYDGGATWTESQAQASGNTPSIVRGQDGRLWIIYADVVSSAWEVFTTSTTLSAPLTVDRHSFSGSAPATVNFSLNAGTAYGGRNFLIAGSLSGTHPGTALPGGLATIPLNRDWFTNWIIANLQLPVFSNFWGTLDGAGHAVAPMNVPTIPTWVGTTMYFAFATANPWDFASNAVVVAVVP